MVSRDYKAVQDAQLRYDTYVQCRRFDRIVQELLSSVEELSFTHSALSKPARGREEVIGLFGHIAEHFEKNGGFLRTDACTSQVLTFAPEGNGAVGTWLTIGVVCEMGAYGRRDEPYPLYRIFGQRQTHFVLEAGSWRMQHIAWRELCRLGPTPYRPSACTGWSGTRERRWELPPTEQSGPWEGRRCR